MVTMVTRLIISGVIDRGSSVENIINVDWCFSGNCYPENELGRCSKISTPVDCQNDPDKQRIPRSDCFFGSSLIRGFAVCFSDKHFVSFSTYLRTERKIVQNLRTFTLQ